MKLKRVSIFPIVLFARSKRSTAIAIFNRFFRFHHIFRHLVMKHVLVKKRFIALTYSEHPTSQLHCACVHRFNAFSDFIVAVAPVVAKMAKPTPTLTTNKWSNAGFHGKAALDDAG